MNRYPKVSVVIPVHNTSENLADTLSALLNQSYPGEVEIIAVDNNSTDGSDQIAANTPGVTLVHQKEIQNAAATRNKGIVTATGQVIAFIDSDCIPAKDWLIHGITAMQENNVDRVGGKVEIKPVFPDSALPELLDALSNFNQERLIQNHKTAMTGNFIAKKSFFEKTGLFDPDFYEFEDIELGKRATAINSTICYAPKCIVWHSPRNTLSQIWRKSKRNGRGIFIMCRNNPKWSGLWGWKHPVRPVKLFLTPRLLNWETLSFASKEIDSMTRFYISLSRWFVINIPEALGYWQCWINSFLFGK